MNQAPYQTPSRASSQWHTAYAPLPWLFWVRIAQLALTVITLILFAYSASQLYVTVPFVFFVIAWSIIYIPLVVWLFPRIKINAMPNVIAIVLESLTCLWWLNAFAITGAVLGGAYLIGGYKLAKRQYSYSISSSSYDDIVDDALNDYYGNFTAGWTALKVATAVAAINWALFVVSLVAISIRVHKQRREKQQQLYQAHGNPNNIQQTHGGEVQTDKYPSANVSSMNA